MKTADLIGPALDWAVAKCEGLVERPVYGRGAVKFLRGLWKQTELGGWDSWVFRHDFERMQEECEGRIPTLNSTGIWHPTTNWSQGGPISERARICSRTIAQDGMQWSAYINSGGSTRESLGEPSYGPTELIAKMRCYVASKLGEEVDIPEALT